MGCKMLFYFVGFFLCVMTVHVSAQCTQPAGKENTKLIDEYLLTEKFADGATVKFECVIGYTPVVSSVRAKTITCNGNQWTELALSCKRKSCGSLPDFPNGRYEIPDGILFGDTVTAVCDEGYSGFGLMQKTCRAGGWDGREPYCEVVKCISPPEIENGYTGEQPDTIYDYSMAVTYKCKNGLTLIGEATLHCAANGQFKPYPPKCIDVSCENPVIPNAVRIAGKSPPYKMDNFIDYKCNDGFEMKGDYHIVCKENGWTPKPPQCISFCRTPAFEGHVTLSKPYDTKNTFLDGTHVTFECLSSYKPVNANASNLVTCWDRKWTNLELTCKEDFCRPPAIEGHVKTSMPIDPTKKFPDGTQLEFECKFGYEAVDLGASNTVTCKDTKWTDLKLKCKGYCARPAYGENVIPLTKLDSNKFTNGSEVEFNCKSGYTQVDAKASKFITCVETKWTNLNLICKGEGLSLGWTLLIAFLSLLCLGVIGFLIWWFCIRTNSKSKNENINSNNDYSLANVNDGGQ